MRVIDCPGIDFQKPDELVKVGFSLKAMRDSTGLVKLFAVVLNGKTRAMRKSITETISVYEEIIGADEFWSHVCFVVSHFSNS